LRWNVSNPCVICHEIKSDSSMHFIMVDNSTLGFFIPTEQEIQRAIDLGDLRLEEKSICDDCWRDR
jgi:hypothetical protein